MPQWSCRYMVEGLAESSATLCTHCPTSGCRSGWEPAITPRFVGVQCSPSSSDRNVPAAEIPTCIRFGRDGSNRIVCRHIPPAPGFHFERVGWSFSPGRGAHESPSSSDLHSEAGSTPRNTVRGSDGRPGAICQMFLIGYWGEGASTGADRFERRGVWGEDISVHFPPQFRDRISIGPHQPLLTAA